MSLRSSHSLDILSMTCFPRLIHCFPLFSSFYPRRSGTNCHLFFYLSLILFCLFVSLFVNKPECYNSMKGEKSWYSFVTRRCRTGESFLKCQPFVLLNCVLRGARHIGTFSHLTVWWWWIMPWIGVVIDDVISSRNAKVDDVMRTRHLSHEARRWLAGLCLDGGTLQFCRSKFNVFFFDAGKVCLGRLRLAWVDSTFAIAVWSGVQGGLKWESEREWTVSKLKTILHLLLFKAMS